MVFPISEHLKLWRNADTIEEWHFSESGNAVDFTGYTGSLEIRHYPGAPGSPLLSISTVIGDGEGVRLNLGDGTIRIWIDRDHVRDLPLGPVRGEAARLAFDLLLVSPTGIRENWVQGLAFVEPAVTVGD